MANDLATQMHRSVAFLLLVFIFNGIQVHGTANSQNDDSGLQPSRLRALLVTDLRNILIKNV